MCHPPLVCPLCSSAGGFPSPGALWLGLIGVANRLLSCPVCHELLLGLDKLTIHLVSHVPDLNLLASTIGNCVNSNQKIIHEFGGTEPCTKRLQKSNYTFNEDVSHTNHHISSTLSCKSYEELKKCDDPANISDSNSNIPKSIARSNKNEKELPSVKASCFGDSHDLYNQSIQDGLGKKISLYHPIGMKDSCTQTVKVFEVRNSAGNVNVKVTEKVNSKLNAKFSPEEDIKFSSNQFLPYSATCQTSDSNIIANLTDKEDKSIIQTQCNSFLSTSTNQTLNKSLKRSNIVLAPSKMFFNQATKNTLQKCTESVPTYEKQLERSTNTVEDKTFKCDGGRIKNQCCDCNAAFDDPRCLSLHHIMVHPNTDALQSLTRQTISPQTNFPCQLCNRKLVCKGELLVHMQFAHSIVPENFLGCEFGNEKEDPMLKPNEEINEIADVSHSQSEGEDNLISKPKLLRNHEIEIKFPEEPEEKSSNNIKEKKEIMDYLVERQDHYKDSSEIIDTDNSQDINKDEYSNGSPPQQCSVEEETKHICKICEAQFNSIMELIAHRPAHSEEDGCICVVCGKTFKKEQHLQQHLRTHEGKQWECDICSKFFTTKYFLKKHKRLHTGEMPYSCETCGKTFTFQQSYHKHLLYHSDEKPHACGECGKRFKELSTLHNHERIHTGEKPFTCESCGKAFRQRVSYLVHRRIHTGVMPYKCTVCEKSFRYKVSQRTHKCSSHQTGTVVRQSSDLVERLLSHQRDRPSVSDSSSVGEVFFSVSLAESLSNQSQSSSQHSNETLQELPTFSHTLNVVNDKKIDSYSIVSASLQPFPANMPTIESPSLTNPFSISKTAILVQEPKMPIKSTSNSSKTINCKESTRGASSEYHSQMLRKENDSKISESHPSKIEGRQSKTSELESNSEQSSDSTKAKFSIQSDLKIENHQDSKLKGGESLCEINEMKNNANILREDIFNQTLFTNAHHILDSSETDFFTMVMSPAEPALEQLGKLTISSVPSPEKVKSVLAYQDNKQYGGPDEESRSQIQPPISPTIEIQKNLGHFDKSSENALSQVENPPSSREQESTANASDLSSFLQSYFDQWNSSNITLSEKTKEALPPQHQSVKHDQCPSDTEDNRLQTINEESLKKLLYGDNTP